jgi:hypothetical protein
MAKIREPKAREPKWYLKARKTDFVNGMVALSCLKYQIAADDEIINYPRAKIKALSQSPANT